MEYKIEAGTFDSSIFSGLGNNVSWNSDNISDQDLLKEFQQFHVDIGTYFMDGLYTHKSHFTIVLLVLYSVIFTVGLVGNSLVIIVVIKCRHMRTVTNMFLMNLSIGDLLVVVVCMPFSLAPYVYMVSNNTGYTLIKNHMDHK